MILSFARGVEPVNCASAWRHANAGHVTQAFPAAVNQSSFIMISCAGDPNCIGDACHATVQAFPAAVKQSSLIMISFVSNPTRMADARHVSVQAFPAAVKQSSFIMISCAGDPKRIADGSMDATVQARVLAAKQRGEASVRQCGLAYTVIRPGPLVEEPGGYRGLVFDQVSCQLSPPVSTEYLNSSRGEGGRGAGYKYRFSIHASRLGPLVQEPGSDQGLVFGKPSCAVAAR